MAASERREQGTRTFGRSGVRQWHRSLSHEFKRQRSPGPRWRQSGLWSWLTTVDHKRIAKLYGVSAFIFFLLGGLEAMLIRAQLTRPENNVVDAQRYNELFTMHGTTMIFLVVMPLSVAFFNLVVPLQIGARDVAFPRLNGFSYWTFLAGALILNIPVLFSLPGIFARIAAAALDQPAWVAAF